MEANKILPKSSVTINLIVGVDKNGAIGFENKILFDCPEDTKFYKDKTENTIVVMGRGTFQSLDYQPLPNRQNIVVSSSISAQDYAQYSKDELLIFSDFVSVINYLNETLPTCEVYIIGGESVYAWFMQNGYINNIYLNVIDKEAPKADRFFPSNLYAGKYSEIYSKAH